MINDNQSPRTSKTGSGIRRAAGRHSGAAAPRVAGHGDNGSNGRKRQASGSRPGRKPDPFGRDKLLDAAALAFMEHGYAGTTIDDVADLLGATKGFFYHHFSSKGELYLGVIENSMRLIDGVVRLVFEQDLRPDRKLEQMAREHVLVLMHNFPPSKVGVHVLEQTLFTAVGVAERRNLRRIMRMRKVYESMFRKVVEEGMKAGLFRKEPVGLMTRSVLGALNWLTVWFDPKRKTTPAQRRVIAEKLAVFVTKGLRR